MSNAYSAFNRVFFYCIDKILQGKLEDGRKRALFILVNFLKHMGWPETDVETRIKSWNATNEPALPENYVIGQLTWSKKQKQIILPPNCSNKAYYQDMGIKCNYILCGRYKNPVNYAQRVAKRAEKKSTKKVKKKATKGL